MAVADSIDVIVDELETHEIIEPIQKVYDAKLNGEDIVSKVKENVRVSILEQSIFAYSIL